MRADPEGDWYAETWRAAARAARGGLRGARIVDLLAAGERSHWHRFDADEVWQFCGGPLELRVWVVGGGGDHRSSPWWRCRWWLLVQVVVPLVHGRSSSIGSLVAVGCIVTPAFGSMVSLAAAGWEPPVAPA